MSCARFTLAALALAAAGPSVPRAAVLVEERSTLELGGALSGLAAPRWSSGAGEATGDGEPAAAERTTIAVRGNRKKMAAGGAGVIVDLDLGAVYAFDASRGAYRVGTAGAPDPSSRGTRWEHDAPMPELSVAVERTGRTRTIRGADAREVVVTVTARAAALRAQLWMAPRIAELQELADFDRRHAGALATTLHRDASPRSAAAFDAAADLQPVVRDVLRRLDAEVARLDGTPVSSTVTVDLAPEQRARASRPFGRLVRPAALDATSQSSTALRLTTEVLQVTTVVGFLDLALPEQLRRVE